MKQMEREGVRPDLYTFNTLMGSLARNREVGRMVAMYTLNEMKALGIGKCLSTLCMLKYGPGQIEPYVMWSSKISRKSKYWFFR